MFSSYIYNVLKIALFEELQYLFQCQHCDNAINKGTQESANTAKAVASSPCQKSAHII